MHSMGMYKNCQHFHHYQKSKYKVFVCVRRVAMVATQPSNPTDSPLTGLLQKAPPLRRSAAAFLNIFQPTSRRKPAGLHAYMHEAAGACRELCRAKIARGCGVQFLHPLGVAGLGSGNNRQMHRQADRPLFHQNWILIWLRTG